MCYEYDDLRTFGHTWYRISAGARYVPPSRNYRQQDEIKAKSDAILRRRGNQLGVMHDDQE